MDLSMAPPEFHTFLFTSVIANNGGTVECVDVNVGKYPIKVTATFFDGAGIAVGTSGEQTLTCKKPRLSAARREIMTKSDPNYLRISTAENPK